MIKTLFKIIIAIFVFFIAFFIFVAVRTPLGWVSGGFSQLDPVLGFKGTPNYRSAQPSSYSLHLNAYGFRSDDFTEKNIENGIFIVGPSTVFGSGVNDNQTISFYLERILNKQKINLKVVNAGFIAYSNDQTFKLIVKRILKFKPKHVIWLTTLSHFECTDCIELYSLENNATEIKELDFTKDFFYKSRIALDQYFSPQFPQVKNLIFTFANHVYTICNLFTRNRRLKQIHKKFELFTDKLNSIKNNSGVKFSFGILPDRYNDREINISCKIPMFNLSRSLNFSKDENLFYLKNDFHFNRKGNEMIAKEIFKKILLYN